MGLDHGCSEGHYLANSKDFFMNSRPKTQAEDPRITKDDTFCRRALTTAIKLAITLRFLATGDSYKSLMCGFRVADSTMSTMIPEVCEAIITEYKDEAVDMPRSQEQWQEVADEFARRWQFHHCLGAIDGKHIAIKKPNNGGSFFFNYKGFHSLVLLALVGWTLKQMELAQMPKSSMRQI